MQVSQDLDARLLFCTSCIIVISESTERQIGLGRIVEYTDLMEFEEEILYYFSGIQYR